MSTPTPPPGEYREMPAVGTMKICQFCHMVVELKRAESGWHYWCAAADPVDGRHHCLGGQTSRNAYDVIPRTLHLPGPAYEGGRETERWYHRYTPDGEGRFA